MPAWVDLSEHQVSLNVYNSPEGKRLILRPLAPQSQIPPDITELGFEPRGDVYERRDLQFSLPQLRKYFPKAVSREFAISEIFFRPEEPAASAAIERYQWQRNRAGGQTFGNRQEIRSLTEALFNEHVKPGLRPGYADTLSAYRAKQPTVTHCSLVQVAGTGEWRLDRVGSLDECRPRPENPAWVKKVDDFFSSAATEFGGTADDEARPQYRDGRTIPIEGDDVVDVRGGFGGSAVYLNGKVISRRGALRVEIVSTAGFFGETASAATEPLSDGWTVKGEEHPYDRQLRQSRERDEQWRKENEAREAELRARAEASKAEGYPHLDMIDPPVGTRIEEIDSGRTGTIIEYFELNDAQEPVVLFDDEPAGSSGVTIGNKPNRYRYRVIAAAPLNTVEETATLGHATAILAAARAPWHVPKAQFIEDSKFLIEEDGHGRVIFDDIGYQTEETSPKKAKEEIHARLVKDALQGRNPAPFPASLPTFEVMLDYPNLVYQLNQRAEKNVSRLLAQLGVAGKLLAGEDGYLKVENPPYIDLVIERLPDPGGDRLYLTHYLRMNGDSVLDAEMVFDIRKNGTLRLAETATQNPIRGGELRGRDVSFANMFSKNLLDQGFGAGKVLWPREERADALGEHQDEEDQALATVAFAVGQRIRFARGLYEGNEGTVESISPSGRIVVRGDRGTGFGVNPDEAIQWGLQVLEQPSTDIDPTSPDGYALVMADEALQLKHLDTLDAFFGERIVAVRNTLRDLGWQDDDAPAILKKNFDGVIASATIDMRHVGAGKNVVGIVGKVYTLQSGEIQSFADDLTGTTAQLAEQLDEAAFKAELTPAPVASPADLYAADLMGYWVKLGKEPNRDLAAQRSREFFEAISTRNADELIDRLRPSLSPLSRTWFEKVTGLSLGRTWKESKIAIRAWANEASATLAPPSQAAELAKRIAEIETQLPVIASKGVANLDVLMTAFNDARSAQSTAQRAAPGQEPEFEQYIADKLKALNDAFATVLGETAALPDYVRGVEGSLAREAWNKSCAEHEEPIKRVIDGYWQMARAVWHSPAGESAFPDNVKTAIQTVGDTLRFGYPSDWSFDGALAHLFKASEKLAQELETADIEQDAGFRHGQRHSNASYRDDAARYETLREKTIKGATGGLIAFGDAIIVNIDDSPLSRFAKAYQTYVDRIDAEIQRLSVLAIEKDKSDAAQAEAALQAKFSPFDSASVRMPTAIQLGLDNKFQTNQGEPLLRLIPGGWSNGHILDIEKRPKLVTDAIGKYYGDETNPDLRKAEQKDIDRIVNQAKGTARIRVEPIAAFDDEFVEQGAIRGSGLNMKREKDRKVAINAVVLGDESAGVAVQLDRRYYAYFAATYKGCEFLASQDGTGAMLVRLDDRIVGVAMPIRVADDMTLMLGRALAARAARPKATVPDVPDGETSSAGTTPIPELTTNDNDTVVWNGKAVPRAELAQFRHTVLAMIADATQAIETARRGKQRGDGGVVQRMQAKVAERQGILRRIDEALGQAEAPTEAAIEKVKVYGASDSPEIAAVANTFMKALNAEIAAEERQAASDPAFQVKPLSDALTLVARNDDTLEVRSTNRDCEHVVTVAQLAPGQYKARQGSAESIPATLLTAIRWADNRLAELLLADRRAKDNAERARREMEAQCREIKCYIDGFHQFLPTGMPLDRAALMEAVQAFTSAGVESTTRHTMNVPRFLSSGAVRSFTLPDGATLELSGENALRIAAAGYTCEIHGTEPAPEFSEDRPWIRRDYERNAPMSFVGALSSACAWLKENQAWEDKKATYPDGGHHVEVLARQYAAFLHEAMPTHHDGGARDMHRCFAVAIMDKEVDYLLGWIARGRGQNELSKKFFTKATGCKLPGTIRDITAAIYAWAGFTPEQAAARETEKEAAHEARMAAKRIDDEIRWSGDILSNTRVNHEGEIKTAKQFLDEILDQGYTEIRKYKSGAVDRYALVNPEIQRSYLIKGKMVDYAKAVLAKRAEAKPEVANEEVPEAEPQHALLRP